MNVADITSENVAKAVGGTIERDGSIVCRCPIHEASGTHNPSLVLTITGTKRIIFHCRSQNCDDQHFRTIRDHLVQNCGLLRSHVGGTRADKEIRYTYQHVDGTYSWTKTRFFTKSGKKRFRCETWDETAKQWSSDRPKDAERLFNLAAVAVVLAAYPDQALLIVEGEKDVETAGGLGVLATTNADGACQWRVEDTEKLIKLGVRKVVVCPPTTTVPASSTASASPRRFNRRASRFAGWSSPSSVPRRIYRTGRRSRCTLMRSSPS
jgi:hypothetical protein